MARPYLAGGLCGVLCLLLGTGAASGAAHTPAQTQPYAQILGSWARSVSACRRPEFVLRESSASIRTDADGTPQEFIYARVTYESDMQGQVVVQLGENHPYGKTKSKTQLIFQVVGADRINFVQRNRLVSLHRCGAGKEERR